MRAFVGIHLPEDVRASLAQLQRELAQSRADVKWVAPEHLHVTLKFLDEISDAQRQAVETLLGRLAGSEEPFPLVVSSVGAFPSIESPRVIWVGLAEGRERLTRMAQAIEREGAAIPLRKEERPLSPHLTLGRVRSPNNRHALVQRLRDTVWQPPTPWQVATLTLYQSTLGPSGPHYTALAEIPLGRHARSHK